jgi:hypothetical protein
LNIFAPALSLQVSRFRGVKAADTGTTSVFMGPRLVAARGCWNAQVDFDLPVNIENSAMQTVPNYRIRGGLSLQF